MSSFETQKTMRKLPKGMFVYDKKFTMYLFGSEDWHINWLLNSDVTLKDFFKHYDVVLQEVGDD